MDKIKRYLLIAGIIATLLILIIGLILSGKNQALFEKFLSKKQQLKDLKNTEKEKITDLDNKKQEEKKEIKNIDQSIKVGEAKLADLKNKENEIKIAAAKTEPVITPTQPDEILKTLQGIK